MGLEPMKPNLLKLNLLIELVHVTPLSIFLYIKYLI
jgi:hypothetical protein